MWTIIVTSLGVNNILVIILSTNIKIVIIVVIGVVVRNVGILRRDKSFFGGTSHALYSPYPHQDS